MSARRYFWAAMVDVTWEKSLYTVSKGVAVKLLNGFAAESPLALVGPAQSEHPRLIFRLVSLDIRFLESKSIWASWDAQRISRV
ncbi:uncharacterized protein ATNIH1004_002121 [Aspergillus tanneri]|uniref:Uncharacterized protein n=2 Tax=Aspergillus tanneri TaxID=1220188 RepID=A0A5M9MVU2_9EURO|nr:uncharacterized protein ATNIH1004_002121 [Aspergillus tanneri]KAA8649450.1 hypothetical protein ATNIH1004_002121 [Aspergillus tanneri]